MFRHTARLIDANLNRASEGLRVLEDIARFVLDDTSTSSAAKAARHEIARLAMPYDAQLIVGRDSLGDVGRDTPTAKGTSPRDLVAIVRANAKRAEESLRVMEELSRGGTDGMQFDARAVEHVRYAVYDIEKRIIVLLVRADASGRVRGLYAIVDAEIARGRDLVEIAREAIRGGAEVIQYRDKCNERNCVCRIASALCSLCRESATLFVMNDMADVAAAVKAPGLHLGQGDLPVEAARRVVPESTIIGVSCHSVEDVERAVSKGADYLAVGSVYPTLQKERATVVGVELVCEARKRIGDRPLVAIGGIDCTNVAGVCAAGADAIAVIGSVAGQDDVAGSARALCAAIASQRNNGEQE